MTCARERSTFAGLVIVSVGNALLTLHIAEAETPLAVDESV